MYFLWKNTPIGIIRVSCDGLCEFADEAVKSKLRLYSITLSPSGRKEEADVSIVLSEENVIPEAKKSIEKHFASIMRPMGIKASVVWASPEKSVYAVLRSPWVWAGIASCIAVMVNAGSAGFFWVAFWGAAAWFAVHGLGILLRSLGRAYHGR
ncbi:MAG: hypothetical protein IJS28_09600 [Synergistaceae bacterium]|nr:hypothetical protein [Synergistaceae bacterium]